MIAFAELMKAYRKPMVIDADALNILATDSKLLTLILEGPILTPHPGELRRLVGEWSDERDKIVKVREMAAELRLVANDIIDEFGNTFQKITSTRRS